MFFSTLASMWIPSPSQWSAMTLTFDLQYKVRSSVETTEYSLFVSPRLFKRRHNNLWTGTRIVRGIFVHKLISCDLGS